jgi:hypothetical protein
MRAAFHRGKLSAESLPHGQFVLVERPPYPDLLRPKRGERERAAARGKGECDHSRCAEWRYAGHCIVQPVSDTGGDVSSPGTMVSTLNRSSGSSAPFDCASPTKADVIN